MARVRLAVRQRRVRAARLGPEATVQLDSGRGTFANAGASKPLLLRSQTVLAALAPNDAPLCPDGNTNAADRTRYGLESECAKAGEDPQ